MPSDRRRGARRWFSGFSVAAAFATLVAVVLMLGLGTWQLQRLSWKTAMLDRIAVGMASAPMPLPAVITDPAIWDYHRVTVTGRFVHDREMHVLSRTFNGDNGARGFESGTAGSHILTPLDRADGGGLVLVDRGFVPTRRTDAATRTEGQIPGVVTVEGVARRPSPRGWFQPDNDPATDAWFWIDLPAMAAVAGGPLPGLVVEAGLAPNPGGLPVGGQTRVTIPNDHLQYALTWYTLAVVLAVIFVISQRGRPRSPALPPAPLPPAPLPPEPLPPEPLPPTL